MKFFRGNPFQTKKQHGAFSPRVSSIQNMPERIQYKQNAITVGPKPPPTITILIVLSHGTLLGNAAFNNILNPLCSVCIAKISLPAQFHSISIFFYYSTPAGLTSARSPVIYVPLVAADGWRYTSRQSSRNRTPTPA